MNDEHDLTDDIEQARQLAQLLQGIEEAYEKLFPLSLEDDLEQAGQLYETIDAIHKRLESMPELPEE